MEGQSTLNSFSVAKAIINSLIRITPVGLYAGSAISGLVFEDFRASILLLGFVLNEAISYGYRLILQGVYNPQCALMKTDLDYFVLPSPICQTVGFFAGFMFSEMYSREEFLPGKTFALITLILLTIFSRVNIGCKTFLDALYTTLVGLVLGVFYFTIIKDYYRPDFFRAKANSATGKPEDKGVGDFFEFN
jgi:hypothetical protein